MNKYNIILASESRRRSEILSSCGIDHLVMPAGVKEITPKKKNIISSVMKNAERKARAVMKRSLEFAKNPIIIGADTLVTFRNSVIGKPKDAKEAKDLLRKFSSSEIDVFTGISVLNVKSNKALTDFDKSTIKVADIGDKEITKYFNKLGSFDKAGGFSIEGIGSFIFDNVKGSYFNILGLPMHKVNSLFSKMGLNLLDFCSF